MKANDVRKGHVIYWEGKPCRVMDFTHRTPGNLRAFVCAPKNDDGRVFAEELEIVAERTRARGRRRTRRPGPAPIAGADEERHHCQQYAGPQRRLLGLGAWGSGP